MEMVQDNLDLPIFSLSVRKGAEEGVLEFGQVDRTMYKGDLMEAPINHVIGFGETWLVNGVEVNTGGYMTKESMVLGTIYSLFEFLSLPSAASNHEFNQILEDQVRSMFL